MDGFLALYIFMLAAFTGHEIISRVPVILHTPLMSGSNFVHGIVVVGAMVALAHADTTLGKADRLRRRGCWAPATPSAATSSPNACSTCSSPARTRRPRPDTALRTATDSTVGAHSVGDRTTQSHRHPCRSASYARPRHLKPRRHRPRTGLLQKPGRGNRVMDLNNLQSWLPNIARLAYFVAAVLFILGIKRMSSPVTARKGIVQAGWGMVIATVATFGVTGAHNIWLDPRRDSRSASSRPGSRPSRSPMTDMPQRSRSSTAWAAVPPRPSARCELLRFSAEGSAAACRVVLSAAVIGALIGAVSLSGSIIAWAKLDGVLDKRFTFPGQQYFNLLVFLAAVAGRRLPVPGPRRARDHRLLRPRAAVRRDDDAADRRRRHAGGDLAVQRLHRPRRRLRRLSCCRTRP